MNKRNAADRVREVAVTEWTDDMLQFKMSILPLRAPRGVMSEANKVEELSFSFLNDA